MALCPVFCIGQTEIPNTFTDGTPALAEEVNENFTALANEIDSNFSANNERIDDAEESLADFKQYLSNRYIITQGYISYSNFSTDSSLTSQIVAAACPVGTAVTGGGVACFGPDTDYDTTNVGFVASGTVEGNAYIGLCFAPLSADTSKYGPGISVTAICGDIVDTSINSLKALKVDSAESNNLTYDGTATPLDSEAQAAFNKLLNQREKMIQAYSSE